jgi:hypothetical protein
MKKNKYLLGVLTVIAINLSLQTLERVHLIPQLYAAPAEVESGSIPEVTPSFVSLPLNVDGSLNVRVLSAEELDVNIRNIDTYDEMKVSIEGVGTSDELNVNIDEVGGSSVYSGGPIKVKIAQ